MLTLRPGPTRYNEIEPYAAAWLRNLIGAGHIAQGAVGDRSIAELVPSDLDGATQAHFFAGIGVWSYALRLAGWPDDAPVWTGSCPCQPFSAAGRRQGTADARHLWPEWFRLIRECRPPVLFGEQVASPDGLRWFDSVSADLEGEGYAVGAADLCAAGVQAPHIRQRLYFVAYALSAGRSEGRTESGNRPAAGGRATGELAYAAEQGRNPRGGLSFEGARSRASRIESGRLCNARGLAHPNGREPGNCGIQRGGGYLQRQEDTVACELVDTRGTGLEGHGRHGDGGRQPGRLDPEATGPTAASGAPCAAVGPWSELEWLACTDGKYRPTQPGLFPLVDGAAFRVGSGSAFEGKVRAGMLRGYGNAIVPQVAARFIRAFMDAERVPATEAA